MSREWKEYLLSEFVEFNPRESIKKRAIAKKVAMDKLKEFTRKVQGYELEEFKGGAKFKNGDSLVARITPCLENGKSAFVDVLLEGEVGFGSTEYIVVREFKDVSDKVFNYYLFTSPDVRAIAIQSMVGSSGRQRVQLDVLANTRFNLPPLPEQKAIAQVLGSLDDKIELNRKTNETLEQMAQALFKSWFVDFDPVIDNALAAGNPIPEALQAKAERRKAVIAKSAPNGAEGFPSSFAYSETLNKWIPEGWEVKKLSELLKIKHGFAFKGEFFSDEPTNDILLTPGNFKIGGGIKLDKLKYYNGNIPEDYILKKGDLIITMTDLSKEGDTLGYPALVPSSDKLKYLHNQRLGKVEYLTNDVGRVFIYHCLCDREYRHIIVGSASGTTVKHTSPTKILLHDILFSGDRIESVFEKNAELLFEKIEENNHQTQTLTQLRDTLLPKLISGKVRLPEAFVAGFEGEVNPEL